VAALLELAASLGPRPDVSGWTARLQLAAYDQEENGLIGSGHHSGRGTGPVRAMLALGVLGFTDRRPGGQRLPPLLRGIYPDVGDFIGVVGNGASARVTEQVVEALRGVDGLRVESLIVPGDGSVVPDTRRSDHASFWDRGMPALMITDTSFFR